MINSICLVRLSALGDVLMFVPLIRTLQKALPKAKLTWVISPPAYDLVADIKDIEFIVLTKPNSLKDYWRFKQKLQGRHFDILLAAQASFRANILYPLIKAKRKIGYDKLRAKDGHGWFINETIKPGFDHTLDGFLKFAEALGIKEKKLSWELPIEEADYLWAKQFINSDKPVLVVNPAASKPERSWFADRYAAVIRQAQERWGMQVILTGGPAAYDRSLAEQILKDLTCVDLVGKTKPKQLLALISLSDLVLCPDTGPSHMATAVGTPVITLHAVTSPDVSGPYLYRDLAVNCYPQAVKTILKKSSINWGTHAHGQDTMKLITVELVLSKFAKAVDDFVIPNRCP